MFPLNTQEAPELGSQVQVSDPDRLPSVLRLYEALKDFFLDGILWLGVFCSWGFLLWTFFQVYPEASIILCYTLGMGFAGAWMVYYFVEWLDPWEKRANGTMKEVKRALDVYITGGEE